MKKALIALLVAGVLVVAGIFLLLGNLDRIVKNRIEVVGSRIAGVPVHVGRVALDLRTGTGQIDDLRIGNPEGFQAPNAFDLKRLRLSIDTGSIMSKPLFLDELTIDSPVVNLEIDQRGGSNIKRILDSVSANTGRVGPKTPDDRPEEPGESMRIGIRALVITGVTFNVRSPLAEDTKSGTLPAINKSDVGGNEGATPAELGGIILADLGTSILQEAAKRELLEALSDQTDGLLQRIGDALGADKDEP
jgi:hypothetical protein